jgi:hypothetical protein
MGDDVRTRHVARRHPTTWSNRLQGPGCTLDALAYLDAARALGAQAALERSGTVALLSEGRVDARTVVFSDDASKFSERRPDALVGGHVHSELVVTSAQVLHEGVPGDNHPSAALAFETPHWA